MLDIKLLRNDPELVKDNIRKKFQDDKLVLVDEVLDFDRQFRDAKARGDYLRSQRNSISKSIGGLMAKGQRDEAERAKAEVGEIAAELAALETLETELAGKDPRADARHPQYYRQVRAHRPGRQRERRSGALRRTGRARL